MPKKTSTRLPSGKSAAVPPPPPNALLPVTTGSAEVARQNNHARRKNLIGKRFGRLVVLSVAPNRKHENGRYYAMWRCCCSCGKECEKSSANLLCGDTKSCGCLKNDGAKRTKHGFALRKSSTRIYNIWCGMISRCGNKKAPNYHRYGGRGIRVCPRWRRSFSNFLADMGPPPFATSIDRINNNKGYSPKNCRWANRETQANNTSRSRFISHGGLRLNYTQWARKIGISLSAFWSRKDKLKWPMKKIINTPLMRANREY